MYLAFFAIVYSFLALKLAKKGPKHFLLVMDMFFFTVFFISSTLITQDHDASNSHSII